MSVLQSLTDTYPWLHSWFPVHEIAQQGGLENLQLISCKARRSILQQGASLQHVILLLSGRVRVQHIFINGRRLSPDMCDAPMVFAEMEALLKSPHYCCSIEAETDCEYLLIPVRQYMIWYQMVPAVSRGAGLRLANVLHSIAKMRDEAQVLSHESRLVLYFIRAYDKRAVEGELLFSSMTRGDLSEQIGLTVRTLNRILREYISIGAIGVRRGKLSVTEAQRKLLVRALEELGEVDLESI